MKRVGVLYHPLKESAVKLGREMVRFLRARGVTAWVCSAWEPDTARTKMPGTDLVLTVGGDGTILRAAQVVTPTATPITGINLGTLGFMTELAVDEVKDKIIHLLAGEGWTDERALLEAKVTLPDGSPPQTYYALNDVVLARGAVVRMVFIEATIDGKAVTTYKADGVVVATATGSTGYALAAGGPILHPQSREMVLLPLLPHLSASYPLVVPPDAEIGLTLRTAYPGALSIDGHTNLEVASGTSVTARRSRHTLRFLRIHPPDTFYGSLEKRLKGKQ